MVAFTPARGRDRAGLRSRTGSAFNEYYQFHLRDFGAGECTIEARFRSVRASRGYRGALALPGGHMEPGETAEDALGRQLRGLEICPLEVRYVCTLLHRSQEFGELHYFAVMRWAGEIDAREAAALRWLSFDATHDLDLDVDRLTVKEYGRVYSMSPP